MEREKGGESGDFRVQLKGTVHPFPPWPHSLVARGSGPRPWCQAPLRALHPCLQDEGLHLRASHRLEPRPQQVRPGHLTSPVSVLSPAKGVDDQAASACRCEDSRVTTHEAFRTEPSPW